ncbi:MAG: elongation factor G [Spirochaetales bacterium]|jgi:elongation factor G|nr:elongation factor G [Spirochaetales bacterium]
MAFTTDKIRNISITGHGATGKTTLVEQLLFTGGVIPRAESVDSGKTVSDYLEEEISQKISIKTTLSHLNWDGVKINILDTPGSADFGGEVISALRVSEAAVVVVGAKAGVQIETIKIWRRLDARNMPRVVFVNKMERDQADFRKTLEDLKSRFNKPFVPVTVPMGTGPDFKGVLNLIEGRACLIPGAGEKESEGEIPAEWKGLLDDYRELLIESAAEGDDELLNKFFEAGTLTPEEVKKGISEGIQNNKIVPVLCGASSLNSGVKSLLDFIAQEIPSPAVRVELSGSDGTREQVQVDAGKPFSAFVFKTTIDQFSGQLSFLKIVTGRIAADSDIVNSREGKKGKTGKIFECLGKKLTETTEAYAGDICILTKLTVTHTNDTLYAPDKAAAYAALELPAPVHAVAVAAKVKKDEDKLAQLLQRVAEEDKTFQVSFNTETKETVISGMGELQINMILSKIRDSQKIDLETKIPQVAYRETITKASDALYRHKKQTGGHGQFAEVSIQVKPLPRGQQYSFENGIRGMAVSKGYIPGIEKGLHEAMEHGVLAGYPVMDVGVTLVDGKEHPVDSSEMAFKLASREALKSAMEKAGPVILEPVLKLMVFVEDQYMGDVLSDLSSRRGRVLGQDQLGGGIVEVKAEVPQAELLRYAIDLKAMTSGTGTFETEFDHYSPVQGKHAEDIVKAAREAVTPETH